MGKKKNAKPVLFISYYHEDHELAVALKEWLQKKLIGAADVFISGDKASSIKGAEDWWDKVRENLFSSVYVLVLMTKRSINQRWIYFEAGGGYFLNNKSMPLLLNVAIDELKEPLSKIQSFDLTNPKEIANMFNNITEKLKLNKKDSGKELSKKLLAIEERIATDTVTPKKNLEIKFNVIKTSEKDAKIVLRSWVTKTPVAIVGGLHFYKKLDEQLELPSGSAKKFLKELLMGTSYQIVEKGDETILLKHVVEQPHTVRSKSNYVTDWISKF
ncbi:MAG: toll/interleukin-1 receptor domain-containing protein [Ignavibacteriaceae bacterium]